jgi:hypothetical protein
VQNIILRDVTAQDIDAQVTKVLRGLGNPEPPLRLEEVRELLRLDRHYYSSTDDGVLREVVSRLMVAGKQVMARPSFLAEAIKKLDLKALFLPDRKRILIDQSLPEPKQRWSEAHEVGHSIVPWHEDTMLGDNRYTLTPACHAQVEAEANYAAGQMLFFQERFTTEARSLSVGISSVLKLRERYGNTIATTLWKYIEQTTECWVGSISFHPHRLPKEFNPSEPLRYFIGSRSFREQFSNVGADRVFNEMQRYCQNRRGGPLGEAEIFLEDVRGDLHVFHFQTFYTTYDALTLGVYRHSHALVVQV